MNVVRMHRGLPVFNLCGRYYIEVTGQRMGPFSALADALRHIDTILGGAIPEQPGSVGSSIPGIVKNT